MKFSTEVPPSVQDAAARIAGTALGPFIMGQRNVDLEALERRIVAHVIKEMNYFGLLVLAGVVMGSQVVVVEEAPKPKRAKKPAKADKKPG